jgi:hypothetical protein
MGVVTTRTLVKKTVQVREPQQCTAALPTLSYTLRVPCVHDASPEQTQTPRSTACTRPLLLHGDPSQNTTRDTSQQ